MPRTRADPGAARGRRGLLPAADGVVVGDGEDVDARGRRRLHERGGTVGAVADVRVGVQVDDSTRLSGRAARSVVTSPPVQTRRRPCPSPAHARHAPTTHRVVVNRAGCAARSWRLPGVLPYAVQLGPAVEPGWRVRSERACGADADAEQARTARGPPRRPARQGAPVAGCRPRDASRATPRERRPRRRRRRHLSRPPARLLEGTEVLHPSVELEDHALDEEVHASHRHTVLVDDPHLGLERQPEVVQRQPGARLPHRLGLLVHAEDRLQRTPPALVRRDSATSRAARRGSRAGGAALRRRRRRRSRGPSSARCARRRAPPDDVGDPVAGSMRRGGGDGHRRGARPDRRPTRGRCVGDRGPHSGRPCRARAAWWLTASPGPGLRHGAHRQAVSLVAVGRMPPPGIDVGSAPRPDQLPGAQRPTAALRLRRRPRLPAPR